MTDCLPSRTNVKGGTKASAPVFKLDSPFSSPTLLQIAGQDHDTILDMLCNLLSPLGSCRRTNEPHRSKGRRARKRRKREESSDSTKANLSRSASTPIPLPAIASHLTVGLNSTTRHLEQIASFSDPSRPASNSPGLSSSPHSHLAAVFVLVASSSSISLPLPYAHLPLLAHTASLSHPSEPSTRIIPLAGTAEHRLVTATGLPRVGVVGVFSDAPGSQPLIELVREKVQATDVPWLREVGGWMGTNVQQEEQKTRGVDGAARPAKIKDRLPRES